MLRSQVMDILRLILPFVQIAVAILLVLVILLQQRGAGLSAAFGGASAGYYTRRGFERTLFIATIVFAGVFILLALLSLLL